MPLEAACGMAFVYNSLSSLLGALACIGAAILQAGEHAPAMQPPYAVPQTLHPNPKGVLYGSAAECAASTERAHRRRGG